MFTRFSVQLPGDVSVDLLVSDRNWLHILRGRPLTIRGKGYHCETFSFRDDWSFRGGIDGVLTVHSARRDGGAATALAYVGTTREAMDPSCRDLIVDTFVYPESRDPPARVKSHLVRVAARLVSFDPIKGWGLLSSRALDGGEIVLYQSVAVQSGYADLTVGMTLVCDIAARPRGFEVTQLLSATAASQHSHRRMPVLFATPLGIMRFGAVAMSNRNRIRLCEIYLADIKVKGVVENRFLWLSGRDAL